MMNRIAVFIGFVMMFSGCTLYQVTSEETTFEYYPPKSSKKEVVYQEDVTRPHKLIGYVKVNAERNQKLENVIDRLKAEAAAMGADAITHITTVNSSGKKFPKILANAGIRETYTADLVVFEDSKPNSSFQ